MVHFGVFVSNFLVFVVSSLDNVMSLSTCFLIRSMYNQFMWVFDLSREAFGVESQMLFSRSECLPVILTFLNVDHFVRLIYRMRGGGGITISTTALK